MVHRELKFNNQTVYLDMSRSAPNFIRCLCLLCQEVNLPLSTFRVQIK